MRIKWGDLPGHVQRAVESILGDTVVDAVSQAGGFSPGTADRVRTVHGRRAFVKAVSPAQNAHTPDMHRREACVTAEMPHWAPVPRLLGCHDDGTWVALVLQDIEGRHPTTPWRTDELRRVLTVLDEFAAKSTPSPLSDAAAAKDTLARNFGGWRRIAIDPPPDLSAWTERHLDELCSLADRAVAVLAGDTLVHTDLRADNILLGTDDTVTVVDWPAACRGPSWLDTVLLLANVQLHGGHDTRRLLTQRAIAHGADRDDLLTVLIALAGYFADYARRPAPPGLPTLRAFQRVQADALLSWFQEEWADGGRPTGDRTL